MSYTLAQGTTEVRALINESSSDFWSDTEIQSWLNEAAIDIGQKGLAIEDTQNITLVANQISYSSSDESWIGNCIKIYAAYFDDGSNGYTGLQQIHPRNINHTNYRSSGDPQEFCLFNRKIFIWPLTTSAIVAAGGIVTCLYAKEINDFTALTDEFQPMAFQYAAAKAMQKDQKDGRALAFYSQYLNSLQFARSDLQDRTVDPEALMEVPDGAE